MEDYIVRIYVEIRADSVQEAALLAVHKVKQHATALRTEVFDPPIWRTVFVEPPPPLDSEGDR